jgi:hypothetical protein
LPHLPAPDEQGEAAPDGERRAGLIHRASVGEMDRTAVEPADATPQWASRPA